MQFSRHTPCFCSLVLF
uniref:Uncharacterized protein n=1 Tax=Rhizophora mucronata TaxID=61149 RepID=A0A2P2PV26_RHIMU